MKVVGGKRNCIANSILNVGSSRAQKAIADFKRNGPQTYATVQRHLVHNQARQYLQEATLSDLQNLAGDRAFIVHWGEHAAGITVGDNGNL